MSLEGQLEFFENFYSVPKGVELRECNCCHKMLPISAFRERIYAEGKSNNSRILRDCYACEKLQRVITARLHRTAPPKPVHCECCGVETDEWNLDHCHDTHTFRGWLCVNCNVGIGRLGDDVKGLKLAVKYLEKVADRTKKSQIIPRSSDILLNK